MPSHQLRRLFGRIVRRKLRSGRKGAILKAFPANGLVKSVIVLASGTAAGQIILLLSAPLLTRLYSPDQFGLLAVYMAAINILGAVATLRYELVIPLPKRDSTGVNVLALSVLSSVIVAALAGLILIAASDYISAGINTPGLSTVSWLVPFGILATGAYTALSHWSVRKRNFSTIARTKLTQSVSQTAIQIAAPFTPFAVFGLLFGNLLGQSAGIGTIIREILRQDRPLLRQISWSRIWFLARRFWEFPAYSVWGSVAFAATNHISALVLFYLFNPATAGFYLLAQRIGMMPITLISTAISQSMFRTLAEAKAEGKVGQAVITPVETLMNLTIAPAAFAAVLAPSAASFIFGADWIEAGYYLQWMAPWLAVTLIFGAMTPVGAVMEWQIATMAFQIVSLLVSVAAMLLAAPYGPLAAVAAFSLVKAATITVYRLYMLHYLGTSPVPIIVSGALQLLVFSGAFWTAFQLAGSGDIPPYIRWGGACGLMLASAGIYAATNFRALRRYRAGG